MEVRKPEYVFRDERGELLQVISGRPWKQLNILKRRAGSLGGGHYHQNTQEFFYVLKGNVQLSIFDTTRDRLTQSATFGEGDCFIIMPFEQHYMKFLTETILVVLYTEAFNQEAPDVLVDPELPSLQEVFTSQQTFVRESRSR